MVILTIFRGWHFHLMSMVKTAIVISHDYLNWLFKPVSCYTVFKKSATPSIEEIKNNVFSEITVLLKLPWHLFGQVCVYSGMKIDVCQ